MRVLTVTSVYPTEHFPVSGTFIADQVHGLRSAGVDVDVFCINPRLTRLDYGLKVPALVRRLRSTRYDIVHTHHTYSLLVMQIAGMLARSQVPVVLTSHEGEVLDTVRKTRTWHPTSRLRHSLLLKRFAAQRADFVIFVSARAAAVIASGTRYDVIPCGVDLDRFKPVDREMCRDRLRIPSDAPVVFFPNDPHRACKRFPLARAAYAIVRRRMPGSLLLTAGDIPHDQMPLYYNAADVVLQTSFYEASPTVVKEGLACEVPLVSTEAGDTRDVINGVPNCFICRDDSSDLADRVLECLRKRAMGGRERLRALGLTLDQVAERVIRVYRQLI